MWERISSNAAQISQLFIWMPLRILFFGFGKLKVHNWEAVRHISKDSFIMVANHVSFLDPFLLSHLFPFSTRFFPFRYPTFPGHYYTWKRPFMWALGSYPVFKGRGLESTSESSLFILREGGRILLFPEGKIKRKGRRKNARRGVAYLAAKAGVPILPCYIEGFDPHKHRLGFTWQELFQGRYRLSVTFGEPFFIQDMYGKTPQTMQEYREAAEQVMKRVYELTDHENRNL